MKVVQINSECGRGSTGKIAVSISKILYEQGVENYIFYSGNHTSDYPYAKKINSKLDLRIHQILSRIMGDQGLHSYFATKRMIDEISKIKPDVIHLHNIHGYYLHFGLLFEYLSSSGIPVVWTLHDCWAFTGHCTHFLLNKCEKWKTQCYGCANRKRYPYSLFFDRSSFLYQKKKNLFSKIAEMCIVTPSRWLEDLVKESFLSQYPTQVINNGIDLSVFRPVAYERKYEYDGKFVVLGVSSVWHYAKGLDVFVELASKLDADLFQIVLVGTNTEIDKILPSSICSIHRTQNQKELAQLYSRADLFFNPTREDNYPTVNLEALACGTPVLTFNTGGSVESVDDPQNDIVWSNTVEEAVQKIMCRYAHKAEGKKEVRCNVNGFDEKECFSKYIELYTKMVDSQIM